MNPMDYYIWENIRGQSQVPSETEDMAELKEICKWQSNSRYDRQNRKRVF